MVGHRRALHAAEWAAQLFWQLVKCESVVVKRLQVAFRVEKAVLAVQLYRRRLERTLAH